MAIRKSFLGAAPTHPELDQLLEATRHIQVSEQQLKEQRVSFAYGNAPASAARITKESVRVASESIRLKD
ncbi:MAG TPA: hypothetical protein VKH62_15490 [Candidatus Binatia bacterium]|jgi:hypothetical protein|nr:hypothetical protein [Candidatus Binatia bacterium]